MHHAFFLSVPRFLQGVLALGLLAGCSTSSNGGGDGACNAGRKPSSALTTSENQEFCQDEAPALPDEVTCALHYDSCGVPLREPPGELTRSANVKEFKGSGAPQVGCYAKAGYPAKPGTSKPVTVNGVAKIFSHGCESKNLTIEFHTVKRTGGADDGTPDQLVGTAVTTPDDCEATGVESDKDENCSTKTGKPYHCKYTYANVPTETELLVKTYGDLWAPLYEYNVYVPNDEATGDMFVKDVRALAKDDYNTIAQVAIGASITATHGALAGEVHDCGDVRLSNAVVDVDVVKKKTVYFTSDEEHPLPDQQADGTSVLGLYAAIDIKEGPVTVSAVGLVGGKATTIGFFEARVFPDSVTSVTFRGLRPFQMP